MRKANPQGSATTEKVSDAEACVDRAIDAVGKHIVLALPLGLGKANLVANAFFQRAQRDPDLRLHIVTALSFAPPRSHNALGQRFLQPFVEQLYGEVPELLYVQAQGRGELPANVQVSEFFFNPGQLLNSPEAQQNYISSNYTHIVRDLHNLGVNVLAQMLAPHPSDASLCSLSCNTDLTADLMAFTEAKHAQLFCIGELNPQLPYMPNDALLKLSAFDCVFEAYPESAGYPLFSVPNQPISLSHYAIAVYVSSLIEDGGTLQIGIGSMGDAIATLLALRHNNNAHYCRLHGELINAFKASCAETLTRQTECFEQGLYAATEMLVEGLLHLRSAGVLTRTVTENIYCHAGFFVGSAGFYNKLRALDEQDLSGISMTRISFVNQLYQDETLKRQQRKGARFINSAMMVTLSGAIISDALREQQVVSGVGGQYNFIAQAHALDDSRSIICLPSTRLSGGKLYSNIVWQYEHETIPRHLRDIVVTEYGIADLRGQSDRNVIVRMLAITDARFQSNLLKRAQQAGKVERNFEIPSAWKNNCPEKVEVILARPEHAALLPYYPMGSDFSDEEAILAVALQYIKSHGQKRQMVKLMFQGWLQRNRDRPLWTKVLQRMQLAGANTAREKAFEYLLLGALAHAIDKNRLGAPNEENLTVPS